MQHDHNRNDKYTLFKMGNSCEIVETDIINKYETFCNIIHTFPMPMGVYVVPESYDLFIIYLNYIRYKRIICKDVDMLELAIEVNTAKYQINGFNEYCRSVIEKISTPKIINIKIEDGDLIIEGRSIHYPVGDRTVPHDIWSMTDRRFGKSIRSVILDGVKLYKYEVPSSTPYPNISCINEETIL